MRILLLILSFSSVVFLFSQESMLQVIPFVQNEKVVMNQTIPITENYSIEIETLKMYLSAIQINQDPIIDSVYLLDFEEYHPILLPNTKEIKEFSFSIGLDSIKNVSENYDGALDPIHGMYWAWHTGYTNFKLKGKIHFSTNETKDIELHLGGYLAPFQTVQNKTVKGNLMSTITIQLQLEDLIEYAVKNKHYSILSPGKSAYELSSLLPSLFQLQTNEK